MRPRPGMANVRPIPWTRARVLRPRVIDVYFWSGVEPCHVLDRVEVDYRRRAVRVTLFEGHEPGAEDTACIEIAVKKVVRVRLEQRLRGRPIRDGAR